MSLRDTPRASATASTAEAMNSSENSSSESAVEVFMDGRAFFGGRVLSGCLVREAAWSSSRVESLANISKEVSIGGRVR
jgi:hypothetical protein